MTTSNEKIKNLYIAINNVVAEIGKEGQIDSRHKLTEELMHALFDIDGGEYKPELLDQAQTDAEPVATVEGLINFDGRFALSYGAKVKVGDKLYTHPPAPELKPLSLDEIHQRYKNLRGNEPPHYIDIYRDAEAALGILRGGL